MRTAIFFISIACIIASCKKKDNTLIDPPTEINFSIERVNSDNDYISETKQFSLIEKSEIWNLNNTGELSYLYRDINYEIELKNEETGMLKLSFYKREGLNKDDLILQEQDDEESIFGEKGYNWHYKDFDVGLENFYDNDSNFRIEINGYDIFTSLNTDKIQTLNLKKAIVNGEEKIYADFNFEGDAFGAFDPYKEYEGYIVTNGSFKGIID